LPAAIRSDNGAPFASTGMHGLSALNLWWMQLGIVHQRILPSSPQENGTHERMHRDLKRETTRPPSSSLRAQQRRFNAFRVRYNDERPHEGIGDRTPSALWTPSSLPYPERIAPPAYSAHLEVRRVSSAGTFRFHAQQRFVSHVLRGEDIGLEEVGDGIWNIVLHYAARKKRRTQPRYHRDHIIPNRCNRSCRTSVND
jgi:putative transposase